MTHPPTVHEKIKELAQSLNIKEDAIIILCKIEGFPHLISGVSGTHEKLVMILANAINGQPELRKMMKDAFSIIEDHERMGLPAEEKMVKEKEKEEELEEWEKKLMLSNMFGPHEQSD